MSSEAADVFFKWRSRVIVYLALVSCSLDDQYVQFSAKRGLQCGLWQPVN